MIDVDAAVAAAHLPRGYSKRPEGLFFAPDGDEGEAFQVCGPLDVTAWTNDGGGWAWGAVLEWTDGEGVAHRWAMPKALLAGNGDEVLSRLLDGGLYIAPGRKARERLLAYVQQAKPGRSIRCVARMGWHGPPGARVFALPGETIAPEGSPEILLQVDRPEALPPVATLGTLQDWQRAIATPAKGNTRIVFAISAAFAAPLLELVGAEGGGFHLRGPSSIGKSTALVAAGSVWGGGGKRGWTRQWRATDNNLEASAAAHCDLLMTLDEIGEATPATVGASAYMLANGAGKGRAARDGGARRSAEWRVLFLSTGEEGIADRLADAPGGGRRPRAGQEVRVLDIPADTGAFGIFETLGDANTAAGLADQFNANAAAFYGTAGRAWLRVLVDRQDEIAASAKTTMAGFLERLPAAQANGQVRRAALRFAVVAAAGEIAASVGILPWSPGEAEGAALVCFYAWLGGRDAGGASAEDFAMVEAVRGFIVRHGASRFEIIGEGSEGTDRIINRAGWKRRDGFAWTYLFDRDVFRREVLAGMDAKAAARALHRAGFLLPQNDGGGRLQRSERVPGVSNPIRVYAVRDAILSGAGGDE